MIARTDRAPWMLRTATPLAWRTDRRIATKLMGFSATELGSSLDMMRAAERTSDPRLKRLFFRHGLDEARHAQRFRDAARALHPQAAELLRPHERLHARRQDLHERLGEVDFVAFVYLSEARALGQFAVLEDHFAASSRPELARLFSEIGKDERFHVAYSRRLLDEWRADGRGREVRWALLRVRARGAWEASRRMGRRTADVLARLLLLTLFVLVLPVFALLQRSAKAETGRWVEAASAGPDTIHALRRQS